MKNQLCPGGQGHTWIQTHTALWKGTFVSENYMPVFNIALGSVFLAILGNGFETGDVAVSDEVSI